MKARKKPVEIDYIHYTGDNKKEVIEFTNGHAMSNTGYSHLSIDTLEGVMQANVLDYIIKGVNGEFYPCKPDIFEKTYDKGSIFNITDNVTDEQIFNEAMKISNTTQGKGFIEGAKWARNLYKS